MKLSSITILGMHKVQHKTYDLKNFNYFVGANGSGKSTVLQAIQLALLGYIPGTDKTKSGIFKHCNGSTLMVELTIDADDKTYLINRTWSKTTKDIVASVTTVPEGLDIQSLLGGIELPVFNFNEFIGMSANKLKDWFMEFLPAADETIEWETELHENMPVHGEVFDPEFISECIDYAKSMGGTGLQQVREFNTYLKWQLSFKKGELNRVQSTIQSLIYYEDADQENDVEDLKSENEEDMKLLDDLKRQMVLVSQNAEVQSELESFCDMYDSYEADTKHSELCDLISGTETEIASIDEKMHEIDLSERSIMDELAEIRPIIRGNGVCPYINSTCTSISVMYNTCVAKEEDLNKKLREIREKKLYLESKRDFAINARVSYTRELASLSDKYNRRDFLRSKLHPEIKDLNIDMLKLRISSVEDVIRIRSEEIIKLEANKRYTELTDKLTAEKFGIEQSIDILKAWIKLTDVNGLQSRIMNEPFNKLFASMTSDLQHIFRCREFNNPQYNMSDKSNSFSFGVLQDNQTYLEYDLMSSGEKCLYMLVLLIAIVRASSAKLPIILVDDLIDHLDGDRISSCFETLNNITDVQIILAGVAEPVHPDADEFVIRV